MEILRSKQGVVVPIHAKESTFSISSFAPCTYLLSDSNHYFFVGVSLYLKIPSLGCIPKKLVIFITNFFNQLVLVLFNVVELNIVCKQINFLEAIIIFFCTFRKRRGRLGEGFLETKKYQQVGNAPPLFLINGVR